MPDKRIGELPKVADLYDDTLLPVEQQGVASSMTGAQFKHYAVSAVNQYVSLAQDAAKDAENARDAAKDSADSAAASADKAEQYSGKPPIQNEETRTWWNWDAESGEYKDTGLSWDGNVLYATFFLDPKTGLLREYTKEEYRGPDFRINNKGYMEVAIVA